MNYGRGLIEIRKAMGLSTKEFAEKCGISDGDLFRLEENYEKITKEESYKICERLNIPQSAYAFFCIDYNDVPVEKQIFYDFLRQPMIDMLTECLANFKDMSKPMSVESKQNLIDALKKLIDL